MRYINQVSKSLLRCYLIVLLIALPIAVSAQEVVDTSSPQDILANPTIVVTPSTVSPDCHTHTGCGVMVVKKHYHKPKRRHHIYHRSCYVESYYVSPAVYSCPSSGYR